MNKNDEHNHILDAATPLRAGQPRLPEVLDRAGQRRPKAASHIDKNSGITNGTVRNGDPCRGFEGPELTPLGDKKIKGATAGLRWLRPFKLSRKTLLLLGSMWRRNGR